MATEFELLEKPYTRDADDAVNSMDSNLEQGLSDQEVKERQQKFGFNRLEEKQQKSLWDIFLDQVKSPIVYLLIAAAGLSFAFGDIAEGIAIVVVLIFNAAIGFWMELQARNSMQALKEMDKMEARVRRNGKDQMIDAEEVVPGDILVLEAGDLIPADARLTSSSEAQVNESSLTGESVPVEKSTDPLEENTEVADRVNMIYKGTAMTRGKATALVTATGMKTELGNISEMVSSGDEKSIPLNERLNHLTKKLIWIVLIMAAALGLLGLVTEMEFYEIIQTSIAWAIAAIPEGLPIVASIALASEKAGCSGSIGRNQPDLHR